MGAAGKDPKALTFFIKVNITVTLHTLKSLALVSGNACLSSTGSSREDCHLLRPFFCLLSTGGPAYLCDSVATECLPAAECSALQQPSPHPPLRSLPPCGSLQTGFPPLPPPWPPGHEQLCQNWPTCIKFTTTAAPESVLSNLQLHSLFVSLLQGSL